MLSPDVVDAAAVRDDVTLEAPLLAEDLRQEVAVPAVRLTVDAVVYQTRSRAAVSWGGECHQAPEKPSQAWMQRDDGGMGGGQLHMTERALPSMIAPRNAGWKVVIPATARPISSDREPARTAWQVGWPAT